MFFNPAVGVTNRNGYFIQTTTYLLGRKESSEGDDSFFINVADSDKTYNLEREGLFLFKEEGTTENPTSDFIKYKLDYYSKLGAYTGLEGSVAKLWEFKSIIFDLGLAVSKSIAPPGTDGSTSYTNFFSSGDYTAEWNSSDLFGVILPFRWVASLNFSLLNFKASIEYLSDPWIKSDFNVREENFDWLNYLLAQTTNEDEVYSDSNNTSSFQWSLSGNLSIPNQWAGDFINNFSLNSINTNIIWNTKENYSSLYKSEDIPDPPYPGEAGFLESNFTDLRPYDPGREFFYPVSYTFPQTTLLLSGVLLNYSTGGQDQLPDKVDSDDGGLRSPWGDDDDLNTGEKADTDGFREPDLLENINIIDNYQLFSTKIDYSLSGYFNYVAYTDSLLWNEPSQIDFSTEKSTFTNNTTLNLNYAFSFLDNVFSLSGKNSFITNYLKYFGDYSSGESEKEKENQKFKWQNSLNLKILPLKMIPYFENTSINYTLDTNLYRFEYQDPSHEEFWLTWNKDSITNHKASVNFQFTIPVLTATLLFDTTLWPQDLEQSIKPGLKLSFFNWENSVDLGIKYNQGVPAYEPLNISSVYTPIDKITISEKFQYNVQEGRPESSVSTIRLWDFTASLHASHSPDYEWDKVDEKLIVNPPGFYLTSLSMAYNLNYESPLMWKNRMTMGLSVNTNLNMNLQQYNLSSLKFSLGYNIHIFQFLDFNIKVNSSNDHIFLYFPFMREEYGITENYNFFEDLFKSFNVFSPNQQDRLDSFFNMNSIEVSLVHKLHDWDLEFTYTGKPIIDVLGETDWDSTLSIMVKWNPIEKIKIKVDYKDNIKDSDLEAQWNVDTEFNE